MLLIHGIAASLHDWDDFLPELAGHGYAAYALDLLGHGKSGKPKTRGYQLEWLFQHFSGWVHSLGLKQPPVLVGHSLGGYLALEYARRFPAQTRALVLTNPYYRKEQLSLFLQLSYLSPHLNGFLVEKTPAWLFRLLIDVTSLALARTGGGAHRLDEKIRRQTALDYKRTAPGAYNLPNTGQDLLPQLPQITQPTLLIWGDHDLTLAPASFPAMLKLLPNARGQVMAGASHVPHQSDPIAYNKIVLEFLEKLPA